MHELIGKRVMNKQSRQRGTVVSVGENSITVSHDGNLVRYPFPAALSNSLDLDDDELGEKYRDMGVKAGFDSFKRIYRKAVNEEIQYIRLFGEKKYHIMDGKLVSRNDGECFYLFETDTEMHFTDGTRIKLWLEKTVIPAEVISCEEFNIYIRTSVSIGEKVENAEFTAESWQLLEALENRVSELNEKNSPIACELASRGASRIERQKRIGVGQDLAIERSSKQPITFIWGPPGTGKTTTLAKIALEHIRKGSRVLVLSYSNVSVDEAILRIAKIEAWKPGQILRYGYPRKQEVLESKTLSSYEYILLKFPNEAALKQSLEEANRKLAKNDPRKKDVKEQLAGIRKFLKDREIEAISCCNLVATTVSKALADKAIYTQNFDTVIFDEASMAYVPQIVFSAGLAKKHFCCIGDFRQLPAIVQDHNNKVLSKDIFAYTGITSAVESGCGHEWLVMLNYQYRMHPSIAEFVSEHMYDGLLNSEENTYRNRQPIADMIPMAGEPMGIVDLSDTYSVCIKTRDGSRINLLSAMICIRLAEYFAGKYEVGLITPYSAQARLMLAMIRDLKERNERFKNVVSATVHQFQGSEKPVIIYDAVDCFRMPYPGTLLTSQENNNADRLFNVALTRTEGKFIMVTNVNYMVRKAISPKLMFTRAMKYIKRKNQRISGQRLIDELGSDEFDPEAVFMGDRDEVDSWEYYLEDLKQAEKSILIDMPGIMDDDEDAISDFIDVLTEREQKGIQITIRISDNISFPKKLRGFVKKSDYVTTPLTLIDRKIIWFGEPLCSADFISEGEILETKYFPCMRFEGQHTAKMLKTMFEIPG